MNSQVSFSRIEYNTGIERLVKALPDLQANIRRFLAVRRYESLKVEQEGRKKAERKAKREKQRSYMNSLSNPPRRHPVAPKVNKEKAVTITSPAMASRAKVPSSQKRALSVAEYEQKYSIEADRKPDLVDDEVKVEASTNIMPVQKFDENITKLMKNINDITLTLNMHDSTIIPHTVNNVRIHGHNYLHEEKIGYFDFSTGAASSPPKMVTFGDNKHFMGGGITPGVSAHNSPDGKTNHSVGARISPVKVVAGQVVHSDQISAVLAGIEAEYAVLARTNEQIKAAMSRSAAPSAVPSVVGDSCAASDAPTVATSTHISTHNSHYTDQFTKHPVTYTTTLASLTAAHTASQPSSLANSNHNSKNNSPSRLPSEGLSMYTISTMDSDDESTVKHRSHNSSSRSNLSEAYVPIRRSGDVKLDMMVQETLIRANNSILDTAIQEHKVYEGSELDRVMHKVALQINDTYQAIEGEEEGLTRKNSASTVDSVGLDALTRSITAIQMSGTFAAKNAPVTDDASSAAEYPSTLPSEQSSANNSMDSQISADTHMSELSGVSELTMAIQDILANLSGGLFDRARLQLSGPEVAETDAEMEMERTIQRNDSNYGEAILKRSLSQHQPLEMADYLASVNGHTASSHRLGTSSQTNGQYHAHADVHTGSSSQVSPSRAIAAQPSQTHGASVAAHAQGGEGEAQVELKELLAHQERSMQLIRDSIRAIEAQAQAQALAQAQHENTTQAAVSMEAPQVGHDNSYAHEHNPYYPVDTQAPLGPLAEVRVSPKPKMKKKKVRARVDSPEEQPAPTAKEMAMLRNLGNYLQRQKESQQENKALSYDELMQKAQNNLGLQHIKQQNQAALREEHLQKQVRQELLYDRYHYSQQKHEEEERRVARAAKKEKATALAKARAQHAMMHPTLYDSDQDQDEEEGSVNSADSHHQDQSNQVRYRRDQHQHQQFQASHHHRAPDVYQNSSYSYGRSHDPYQSPSYSQPHSQSHSQPHSQTHSQASIKGYSGAHMDAPYRPYDAPGDQALHNHHQYPHYNSYSHNAHAHDTHAINTKSAVHNKGAHKSPLKEPFNMSDALLQAPAAAHSGSKPRGPKKKKSVDHAPHHASHGVPHYAGKTHSHSTATESSVEGGWNDRFGATEHKHGSNVEGFGLKKDDIRESTEDLYQAKRALKQQQREEELNEYRSSYNMAARALEDEDDEKDSHYADVSSQRAAPRKPAHSGAHAHVHATHNNTHANSHPAHGYAAAMVHKQHGVRQASGTLSPVATARKKGAGASKHHGDGKFDEGLLSSIEHLHLKPPKSIRSSASVEKSPRAAAARLLHPFK